MPSCRGDDLAAYVVLGPIACRRISGRSLLRAASYASRRKGRPASAVAHSQPSWPAEGVHDTNRPGPRHVRNQASKFFNTEQQGAPRRATEKDSMALRAGFDRTPREAPKSWLLRGPPWRSLLLRVEKLACLGSCRGPVIGVPRPADTQIWASRNAPAPAAVLALRQRQLEPSESQFFRPLLTRRYTRRGRAHRRSAPRPILPS